MKIIKFITTVFYFFISYRVIVRLREIYIRLYSFWISHEFKSFGDKTYIASRLTLKGGKYIEIGKNTFVGKNSVLTAWDSFAGNSFNPHLKIGNNCIINEECHITVINSIKIGDNVSMGKRVTITDNAHGRSVRELLDIPPSKRPLFSKGEVIIEDNVWLGEKATILPGVHIGKGAIVGANAVVTANVPAYTVVGGIPAKIIKKL